MSTQTTIERQAGQPEQGPTYSPPLNRHLSRLTWDEIKRSEEYVAIRFCVIKRALASGDGCFECGCTERGRLDVAIPNVGNPKNWRRRLDFMAYECVCVDCKREWKRRALLRRRRA